MAYDFLYQIRPQPEIFEIKQVLKIPKTKIEQRHELMLSIIYDRIRNAEKYEKEHFSKYSTWKASDARQKRSRYDAHGMRATARRRMNGCKHKEDPEILTVLYRHTYWDFKHLSYEIEPFDMHELERLPGEKVAYAEAKKRLDAIRVEVVTK